MKAKLKKFTDFSKSILPHEANYLKTIIKFTDEEKLHIINLLISNAQSNNNFSDFDTKIDKRKYSYIKNWVEKNLAQIDVDITLNWLILLKQKILTDAISSNEELDFLDYIDNYNRVDYNFQTLYELAKDYKSYLLVRMRYEDHKTVAHFLASYQKAYHETIKIDEELYAATGEITNQYTRNNKETKHLESRLHDIFKDTNLNGKNRYQAFILLAFMYNNYNEYNKQKAIMDKIDMYFSKGSMYSRRILSNYYASRVLVHSKQNEFDEAEYYGYLSIRQNNNDTLMYVNNLAAILLRNNKPNEALTLLENYKDLYKQVHNYHQKIGFSSYLMRIYTELKKFDLAETTGKLFLKKYENEILQYRWHHFFTSYLNVLIAQEKYDIVLKTAAKYNLIEKEKERQKKQNYVPNIHWSILLSKYMECQINSDLLFKEIKAPLQNIKPTQSQKELMIKVLNQLSINLPEAFLKLRSHI